MTQPASVPTDGFLGVLWVPSLANPLAPTVAEVNALSRVDISCYLTGGGYANATEEATINDPRLCSRQDFEQPGKIKHSLSLMYVHNPKAPAENAAYLALTYLTGSSWPGTACRSTTCGRPATSSTSPQSSAATASRSRRKKTPSSRSRRSFT